MIFQTPSDESVKPGSSNLTGLVKIRMNPKNRTRLLVNLMIAITVWGLSAIGGFKLLDEYVYDKFYRLIINSLSIPSRVVLVEISNHQKLTEDDYIRLLDILNDNQTGQIVFNFLPDGMSERFFKKVRRCGNVIIGSTNSDTYNQLSRKNIPTGLAVLPPMDHGICRRQITGFRIKEKFCPSLEVVAAAQIPDAYHVDLVNNRKDFLVFFTGGPGSLISLSSERVLANDPELQTVKDCTVLIGPLQNSSSPGIVTPTTPGDQEMSLLEFEGHALNTLLCRQIIVFPDLSLSLFLFILVSVSSFFIYKRVRLSTAAWITILLISFYFSLKFVIFALYRFILPVEEIVILQIALFIIDVRRKSIDSDILFQELMHNLNLKLRERYFPPHIFQMEEYWKQIATMITQTLSLNRAIFLEIVEKEHRVKEVFAVNCEYQDILERRRDYMRSPYSDAIEANAPILIPSGRVYFKPKFDSEDQYIVPLIFGGDVMGFWVFGIQPENANSIINFTTLIENYAATISEVLYNRLKIQHHRKNIFYRLREFLSIRRENELHQDLRQTIELLKRQFENLSYVFNDLSTKTIVYDLFGRVMEVNRDMLELLKTESIDPFEISLAELLSRLTQTSPDFSRQRLRRVIIDRQDSVFMITLGDTNYTLSLKPLEFKSGVSEFNSFSLFGIHGIVCEIVEAAALTKVHEIKEQMSIDIIKLVSKELRSLKDFIPHELEIPRKKITNSVALIDRCENYLTREIDASGSSRPIPIPGHRILELVLKDMECTFGKYGLSIDNHVPESLPYILALPNEFRQIFENILQVLVGDAKQNTAIHISTHTEEKTVSFKFKNSGVGIPNTKFQEDLFGEEPPRSLELRCLKESHAWVKSWKGSFEAKSSVGTGIEITLKLMRFH